MVNQRKSVSVFAVTASVVLAHYSVQTEALVVPQSSTSNRRNGFLDSKQRYQRSKTELPVSSATDEMAAEQSTMDTESDTISIDQNQELELASIVAEKVQETEGMPNLMSALQEKIGTVDDDRLIYPELQTGEVPRMFSSLKYEKSENGDVQSAHNEGSVVGAAALIAGTTIGAGVLALPTATAAAGFLPSTAAMGIAWFYMTISGLLIAELTLNRLATSGRPGLGLLELYENSLGKFGRIGSAAYFFLHYSIMVAYVASGGNNVSGFLEAAGVTQISSIPGAGQALFVAVCGSILFFANSKTVESINNALVVGVVASFLGIVGLGTSTADFGALIDPAVQHPEEVVNCFPILFLALVYQNVVPSVVNQLEGNRMKITNSIIAGTTIPFLMFLAFNGVVLGNALGAGVDLTGAGVDPVSLLQGNAGGNPMLGQLVGGFSTLAVITSLIGFTYGLLDAWTDVFNLPTEGKEFEKFKAPLYALVFAPPLALSVLNPGIFYNALDYAGAFGVSTLFLVLPPFMVWQERYGEENLNKPLATKPMVPFGKIPLASMYKAAGTLIVEQGLDKLGVFDFLLSHLPQLSS